MWFKIHLNWFLGPVASLIGRPKGIILVIDTVPKIDKIL